MNEHGKGGGGLPPAPLEDAALRALTLGGMMALADAMLRQGLENPSSPLRKPALATVNSAGAPAVQTVILRSVDFTARKLGIFTDARSRKVAELGAEPRAELLFYDPACDMQLRLSGRVEIRVGDVSAWASAAPASRRAYLVTAPPGTASPEPVSGLPADVAGIIPSLERMEEGRVNFAFIEFRFTEADLVVLSRAGHRRARIRFLPDDRQAEWLVP